MPVQAFDSNEDCKRILSRKVESMTEEEKQLAKIQTEENIKKELENQQS
jgi:hypothetical protein